jgi:hypothetical protein
LDAWKNNSTGRKKKAIRKSINQLSNGGSPEQKLNRMNLLLSSYPYENNKLNNLVKR